MLLVWVFQVPGLPKLFASLSDRPVRRAINEGRDTALVALTLLRKLCAPLRALQALA